MERVSCVALRVFCLFIGVISWCCIPAAFADEVPQFLRVPVYFVTDRNLQSDEQSGTLKFGPHRKYVGECLHDPFMGSGYCVVKNSSAKSLSAKLISLGWAAATPEEKEGSLRLQLMHEKDFSQVEDKFYTDVRNSALKADRKEVLLFAHGYKNTFDSAYHTAARFSYQFEEPTILFSWPSVAKVRSYTSDENNIEWSQEHFNDLVVKLEEMHKKEADITVRIFAHSMGSRLVVRASPLFRERSFLTEVALVCPDIDQGLVRHYARRYLSVNGTSKIRLYMSQQDKALVFSQLVHGGYCRLGECADSISSMMSNIVPGSAADGKDPSSVKNAEEEEFRKRLEQSKQRMATIDFTELDRGVIGHKIPVELIYNMSYTGEPGPGLKIVKEGSGQRNHSSKMLSRLTRLQTSQSGGVMPKDSCLRVIRDSADRKVASAGKTQ